MADTTLIGSTCGAKNEMEVTMTTNFGKLIETNALRGLSDYPNSSLTENT